MWIVSFYLRSHLYLCYFSFCSVLFDYSIWRQVPYANSGFSFENFRLFEKSYDSICNPFIVFCHFAKLICFDLVYIECISSQIVEVWTCAENVLSCFNAVYFPVWVVVFNYLCTVFAVFIIFQFCSGHVVVETVMIRQYFC